MPDLKESSLGLLVTVDSLDLDALAENTLYTCPTGYVCYVTHMIPRKAAGAGLPIGTAFISFGWNTANADDVVTNAALVLTDGTNYKVIKAKDNAVYGVAAGTFKMEVQTAEGAAATCSIDVFGYLVPA